MSVRLALILALLTAAGAALTGRVERVIDGDSLEVATSDGAVEVRLFGIDAPEHDQPYADAARAELAKRVKGKPVRLEVEDHDHYGRTVARVFVGDEDVNAALVRAGAAWVYRRYSEDPKLLAAEDEARRAKRGLWAEPDPTPPWEWRHPGSPAKTDGSSGFRCGAKHTCREMKSCREARFYLEKCGVSSLDGNGDGVPCASLCR